MKNWKLSKIKISNFKAFEKVEFDFDGFSLLTLEGPNGYGKTSFYDALELLFTGKIMRIEQLCERVMLGGVRNYKDNLFWNRKKGEHDIEIIVELYNKDTQQNMIFSRKASSEDLRIVQNNRADKFDIFKLYRLADFDSYEDSIAIEQNELDEILGEGFSENYTFLNYLEQGQSSFIFSKNIKERKNAIDGLMNVNDLTELVSFSNRIETNLSRKINSHKFREKIEAINSQIKDINEQIIDSNEIASYSKISNTQKTPLWDLENPSYFHDSELTILNEKKVSLIKYLVSNKDQVRIIFHNLKIEDFISKNENFLTEVVKVGQHIASYPDLARKNKTSNDINFALSILRKSEDSITQSDINKIQKNLQTDIPNLINHLVARDSLKKEIGEKNLILLSINKARNMLIEQHKKPDSSEKICLLCGHDWLSKDLLIVAIDIKTKELDSSLNDISNKLKAELIEIKNIKSNEIQRLLEELKGIEFDKDLLESLQKNESQFESMIRINTRLTQLGISYPSEFTKLPEELEVRRQELISLIRQQKKMELIMLPVGWEAVLKESFNLNAEVLEIDLPAVINKEKYLSIRKAEEKSTRLKNLRKELQQLAYTEAAMIKAKEKVSILKENLNTLNRDYSKKTISDIELTFHIYSGRLIQNYQRGLGLFIDEGIGDRLRFCTAEKSEHDATMSMSSGQLSALSLAFFLSLNKVYAKSPLVLIDDPAQSLDEINIASLSDLLRCELGNRQLILSSHEDNITSYLRFRFMRAGLSQKPFHMQSHIGK